MKQKLLMPIELSEKITLKNRIVMPPLTRRFACPDGTPSELSAPYYAKRSDAGLIIAEGTLISKDAIGYGNVPGIYTQKHIQAWSKITHKVHENNGVIFLQLWHCGRVSHPVFHEGRLPISSSQTIMNTPLGNSGYTCGFSREATLDEIQSLIKQFGQAAIYAMEAGFDGVEIHGANGYLIDQFMHHCTNKRSDHFGGSPENMVRFCLDIVKECGKHIGFDRIGLRLSPGGHMAEMTTDTRDKDNFKTLFAQLERYPIGYIHTGAFDDGKIYPELDDLSMTNFIRKNYSGHVIACGGYDIASALSFTGNDDRNLVAFGRPFIANFDLINKIKQGIVWNHYDPAMLASLE